MEYIFILHYIWDKIEKHNCLKIKPKMPIYSRGKTKIIEGFPNYQFRNKYQFRRK